MRKGRKIMVRRMKTKKRKRMSILNPHSSNKINTKLKENLTMMELIRKFGKLRGTIVRMTFKTKSIQINLIVKIISSETIFSKTMEIFRK